MQRQKAAAADVEVKTSKEMAYDVEENNSWFQSLSGGMIPSSKEEEKFIATVRKMIAEKVIEGENEKNLYVTWINLLDPKKDATGKEKIVLVCAQKYSKKEDKPYDELAAILCYEPSILSSIFLRYSPAELIASYYAYQSKYKENDRYFKSILKFIIESKYFSQQDKKAFLKKIWEGVKEVRRPFNTSESDIKNEVLASWHKSGLLPSLMDFFDDELKSEVVRFKKTLQEDLEKPSPSLSLAKEYGSLVFESLLAENKGKAESLTPVVLQFYDQLDYLANIYRSHKLDPIKMFTCHLTQLAKLTNAEGISSRCAALFFSADFKYLKEKKALNFNISELAKFLSATFFVKNEYAFELVRSELFLYWIDSSPAKMLDVFQLVLNKPNKEFETPIEKFFTYYERLPESFYVKLFALLCDKLTTEQLIKLYTAVPERFQHKIVAELISDKSKPLAKLKSLGDVYKKGGCSVIFLRNILHQIKMISPELYAEVLRKKIFIPQEFKEDYEADLFFLREIIIKEKPTHNEGSLKIAKLTHLTSVLEDEKKDFRQVIKKIFSSIPQAHWSDLFMFFGRTIIFRSFQQMKEKPDYKDTVWGRDLTSWGNLLSGGLLAILNDYDKSEREAVVSLGLFQIHEALEASLCYPNFVNNLLKTFFLENCPNSISIFQRIPKLANQKPDYFDSEDNYETLAGWLPEDEEKRTTVAASLLHVGAGFEPALYAPFVRNREELSLVAFKFLITRKEHPVNFLANLSPHIASVIFKTLARSRKQDFTNFLSAGFVDIMKANFSISTYIYFVNKILSYADMAKLDIFHIIGEQNKDYLLKAFCHIRHWDMSAIGLSEFRLIFKIVNHYASSELPKIIFEHLEHIIKSDRIYKTLDCIQAAQEITGEKFILFNQAQKVVLTDYLKKQIPHMDSHQLPHFKIMADFIPDLDNELLNLIKKEMKNKLSLSYQHKTILDDLVNVYGFSHIKELCVKLEMPSCCTYLNSQWAMFPNIRSQITQAMKSYEDFLEEHEYAIGELPIFNFKHALCEKIYKAAHEAKTPVLEVNVTKIAVESQIPDKIVKMMPAILKIESQKPADSPSVAKSVADSWKRSGLISSSPEPQPPAPPSAITKRISRVGGLD